MFESFWLTLSPTITEENLQKEPRIMELKNQVRWLAPEKHTQITNIFSHSMFKID